MYYGYFYFNDEWKLSLSKHEINGQTTEDENTFHPLNEILPFNLPEDEDGDSSIESDHINLDRNQLASDTSNDSYDLIGNLRSKIILKQGFENELQQKELELEQLAKREKELIVRYIRRRNLGIWVGSWNIGGNEFEIDENFVDWTKAKEARYEVYVFNFQEFVKLSFLNISIGRTDENKERLFEEYVQKMLKDNTGEDYFKVNSVSMTGLYQVVFAKKLLKPYIRDILSSSIKTGVYYSIGNKGSVATQFSLFEYNFSLLNVHLNFGSNLSLRRVVLLEHILKNLFKKNDKTVMNSDFFIVSGDFNFCVLLEKRTILKLLRKMQYNRLLNYDEFNIAKINSTKTIGRLNESKISFGPTYKYSGGSRRYTTKRSPAWCDRILFGGRLLEGKKANILSYRRNDNLTASDHRPILTLDLRLNWLNLMVQFLVKKFSIPLSLLSDREDDLNKFRAQPSSSGAPLKAAGPSPELASSPKTLQFSLDSDSGSEIELADPNASGPGQEVQVGVRRRRVKKSNEISIPLSLLSDREDDLNKFRAQPSSSGAPLKAAGPSPKQASGTRTLEFSLDQDTGFTFDLNGPRQAPTQVLPGPQPVVQERAPSAPIPVNFEEINITQTLGSKPHQFNLESEASDIESASKVGARPMEISLDSDQESHGTPVELDLNNTASSNEFDYTKSGSNGIFTAKDGFYFNSVREKNVALWEGKNDQYAVKVVRDGIGRFRSLTNVFIYFTDGAVREFNKESGTWNGMPVRMEIDESGNPIHVKGRPGKKVAVVDQGYISIQDGKPAEHSIPQEEEEIDDGEYAGITGVELNLSNKYSTTSYKCEKEFHMTTFTANEGFGFRAVWYYRDKSSAFAIWTSKTRSQYAYKVVYREYPFKISDVVVHQFNGKVNLLATDGDSWKEFDINKLNPVVVNIDYPYDTYSHTSDPEGSCAVITPKEPFVISGLVEFHGIKNKLREVWRANSADEFPVKVVVDNREFMVVFEDRDLYKNARNINLYYKDGKILYLTRAKGTNWVERSTNKLELDIGVLTDTISHIFVWDLTSATYERRNDFLITKVKHCKGIGPFKSSVNIWTAKNPDEYIKRVIVDGYYHYIDCFKPYNAIIFFENGVIKHMNYRYDRWIEIEPSCIVDITKRECTFEYYYNKDENKIETFIPKYRYLFKGVKSSVGTGSSRVEIEIWEATDPKDYAYRISVVRSIKKEKFLVIFQEKGEFKIFNKYDKNSPWTDHSNNRCSINDIRISGLDIVAHKIERDRTKLEEAERLRLAEAPADAFQPFDPTQYKPAHTILERLRYSKPQPQCLLKPSGSPEFEFKPEPVEQEGKNLLYLDIQKRNNIFGYTISYRGDKVIFKAVEPFLFGIVKSDRNTLWRYRGDEYPNRVLYKEVNGRPKVKVYFPDYRPPPFVMRGPRTIKFDPSTIQVDISKSKKPGSELYKATVVEVSGTPVTNTFEDPEGLFVPPTQPRQNQWDLDSD
ncbi:hypothetical protein MACJ_002533 [Theileria orientalis]|uniref:Inositol polyphosphate-related phosphatase domain-containing protein n=1 Tax=Theileria orientalis TaxID=68886 RepID=A0A976M6D5_THEOR|nr:hypothetical protein MACJ_002533 [Theileria orientalis]